MNDEPYKPSQASSQLPEGELPEVLLQRPDEMPPAPPLESTAADQTPVGRWWLQFSLRWLLVAMAAVAGVCAWWFRPVEELLELGDGALVVRYQVREMPPDADHADVWQQQHGSWRLFDRQGRLLVSGSYRNGQPSGHWTWYDEAGYVVQVEQLDGGNSDSSATYQVDGSKDVEVNTAEAADAEALASTLPDAKAAAFVRAMGRAEVLVQRLRKFDRFHELDHEGPLEDGLRHGLWRHYLPGGEVRAEGHYAGGLREGWWKIRARAGEPFTRVFYLGGKELPAAEQVVQRLAATVRSGQPNEQAEAALALERLGDLGAAPLLDTLANGSPAVRLVALRVAAQMPQWPPAVRVDIECLAQGPASRGACRALTILAQRDRARLPATCQQLVTWVSHSDAEVADEAAQGLIALREHSLPYLRSELSVTAVARRRAAAAALQAILYAHLAMAAEDLGSREETRPLLPHLADLAQMLRSDPDDEVRRRAAETQATLDNATPADPFVGGSF